MTELPEQCDVAVVGGGPVGLLLACQLAQRGVQVCVLEARRERSPYSRAIGLHPPGLSCLAQVGCAEALVAAGIKVRRGQASCFGSNAGAISFDSLPPPYDFVLSIPQRETELALEARLQQLAPHALVSGAQLRALKHDDRGCTLTASIAGQERVLRARFVAGCDGKESLVRDAMNVRYPGGPYPERFIMGDARDTTSFGSEAVVFFTEGGVVECFPLPGGMRRWVVGTRRERSQATPERLAQSVAARTGFRLAAEDIGWVSAFTAERYLASQFARGRVALAGDAAHVISPIGGQGMNLGFLDATALAPTLHACLQDERRSPELLGQYARVRRRAARGAALRAELYMTLGCTGARFQQLRSLAVRALLGPTLRAQAARVFTMQA